MTEVTILCKTIEPELKRLELLFCEKNIKYWWELVPPKSNDGSCFCIYNVYVEVDDLMKASDLLSDNGCACWVGR